MTPMQKSSSPRRVSFKTAVPLLAGALALLPVRVVSTQQPGITPFERDLTRELANKMSGRYVVSAVGDILMQEPMGKMISPEIQKVLRDADTTVGNKEHYVIDSRNWAHGHGNNWAPKELAKDLRSSASTCWRPEKVTAASKA